MILGHAYGTVHSQTFPTGEFDDMGIAEGNVDEGIGTVKSMRLSVHVESDNWAILSEVCCIVSVYLVLACRISDLLCMFVLSCSFFSYFLILLYRPLFT